MAPSDETIGTKVPCSSSGTLKNLPWSKAVNDEYRGASHLTCKTSIASFAIIEMENESPAGDFGFG